MESVGNTAPSASDPGCLLSLTPRSHPLSATAHIVRDRFDMSIYTAPGAQTFTFASQVDRTPIFVRKWLPPCGIRPHATVQITHGIAEHSGRYDRFARFLAAHGHVVYALDLRGHGETAGLDNLGQAGLTAWQDMTADIKQLAEIALAEYPALPLVAFGHSMGSALTQSQIQNHGDLLAGAILCGTMGAMLGLDEAQSKRHSGTATAGQWSTSRSAQPSLRRTARGLQRPICQKHPTSHGF